MKILCDVVKIWTSLSLFCQKQDVKEEVETRRLSDFVLSNYSRENTMESGGCTNMSNTLLPSQFHS